MREAEIGFFRSVMRGRTAGQKEGEMDDPGHCGRLGRDRGLTPGWMWEAEKGGLGRRAEHETGLSHGGQVRGAKTHNARSEDESI